MTPTDYLWDVERLVGICRYPTMVEDVDLYLEDVINTRWFANRYDIRYIPTVRYTNNQSAWADLRDYSISLPRWASTDFTILHELSHLTSLDMEHGELFRQHHHSMVERFMSKEAGDCYRYGCKAVGLDF